MSLQVGGHCYATAADAAPSACASYAPVSTVAGSGLTTVGCASANPDGTFAMYRITSDINGVSSPVLSSFTLQIAFPPCVENEYYAAAEAIAGPLLALLAVAWGAKKLFDVLGWGRGAES